jgi:hypothetical protein
MKDLWKDVWGQNSDTGLLFLTRAINEWLEDGGFLGMVVSGGYANSAAAAKVWELLYPGKKAALRKLVWLEFSGKVWDANVIPMLLIIERTSAKDDDEIELIVPESWPDKLNSSKIKYKDFFDYRVNPRVVESNHQFGDYLLPLLNEGDIALVKRLYPDEMKVASLKEAVAKQTGRSNQAFSFTYGIQRGGAKVSNSSSGKNSVKVIGGKSISVGWSGQELGFVDLDEVKQQKNGKMSLWHSTPPKEIIVLAELAQLPFASIIEDGFAAINSAIVALPRVGGPNSKAVTAYLNSKVAHFYWLIRLRSGVLEGSSRAHVYPRTLEALPWPKPLNKTTEQTLVDNYEKLMLLAQRAKDNPFEWFLAELEDADRLSKAKKLSDPSFGLSFVEWGEDVLASDLELDGAAIKAGLFSVKFKDEKIARFVYTILTLVGDDETVISSKDIQILLVPKDYETLLNNYEKRMTSFGKVESDFMAVLAEIDKAVYDAFALTPAEREHIEKRLSSFPLNRLKPRYPWQTVRPRSLKTYTVDRFV